MHQSMPDNLNIAAHYRQGDVALVNAVLGRCIGQRVSIASVYGTLRTCQPLEHLPTGEQVQFELRMGDDSLTLQMSRESLDLIFGPVCWPAFDPAMQRLLVKDRLESAFSQWFRTFGLGLAIESFRPQSPGAGHAPTIAFELQVREQQTIRIALTASDSLTHRIATAINNSPLPRRQYAKRLRCNLIAGYQQLHGTELQQLKIGSVILANSRTGQSLSLIEGSASLLVEVTLGHHKVCSARAEPGRIRVLIPDAPATKQETNPEMNDDIEQARAQHSQDEARLPVSFRLGKVELTLTDLQGISPGHVFNADINPTEPEVEVCLGDECIGRGRLVGVGDQLGVEVTAWGIKHD